MSTATDILKTFALALAVAACHEDTEAPGVEAAFGDAGLALSCEENLTCDEGVCDLATLECVDCIADSDCDSGRCHPRDHVCVQCVGDADCGPHDGPGTRPAFCHPTRAVCVGCFDDAQCLGANGRGVCHPDKLGCVECTEDAHCGDGVCNLDTFACVGECQIDAECADRNPCTRDFCNSGRCGYEPLSTDATNAAIQCDDGIACTTRDHCVGGRCKGEPTTACCEPLECRADQHPVDFDHDGCNDFCECPPEPPCPFGTTPTDTNGGGCRDRCLCPSGVFIGPDGECPCAVEIRCDGGLVPSDLDGDRCPDTCAKPCENACECQAQGLEPTITCALACAQCGAFLECHAGACVGRCGVVPDFHCECPAPPVCDRLETAFDSDGDGCNDACRCLVEGPNGCACPTAITCAEGSSPIDTDGDDCPDACKCNDPNKVPSANGSCCPEFACPADQVPVDEHGDLCPDLCVCEVNGASPSFAPPACPCKELVCPQGSEHMDETGDGCPDVCVCPDGSAPGPGGCEVCLSQCADANLPPWAFYIDDDDDGCYDEIGECPVGSTAARSPDAGCPDFCAPCAVIECPKGAIAKDTNGDRCPDHCFCEGGQPAPEAGCGCTDQVTCVAPAVPVDTDQNGCADGCRTPCTTACDCGNADLVAPCDCVDCRASASCVDGFCALSCVSAVAACLQPAGDPVCGCDDKTYPSRCDANAAAVDVAHVGVCEGGCLSNADCTDSERCERAGGCDAPANADTSSCVAIPTSCLPANDPICGCDGKTYANDCERLRANTGRAARGACLTATPRTP